MLWLHNNTKMIFLISPTHTKNDSLITKISYNHSDEEKKKKHTRIWILGVEHKLCQHKFKRSLNTQSTQSLLFNF